MEENYKLKGTAEEFQVIEESSYPINEKGDFLIFRMKKKWHTTEDAVQNISRALKINRKNIGYAGAKDSNAVTWQNISIRGVQKESVLELNLKNIELEFLGYRLEPLSLGDLDGNRFEIVIRNITTPPRKISKMLNIFGVQRFGTNNVDVGKSILMKDFKKAIELIAATNEHDKRVIDEHLVKNKNDYVGALKQIPWKNITMYIHALQSKIWNETVEEYTFEMNRRKNRIPDDETIPLVGFATEYKNEIVKNICQKKLEKEGITQSSFIIRAIPELTSAGDERKIYTEIKNLEIGTMEDDDLNPSMQKCKVMFSLGKGSYATQAIKSMMNSAEQDL